MSDPGALIIAGSTRRVLKLIALVLGVLTVLGMVFLRPGSGTEPTDISRYGAASRFYDGRVTRLTAQPCTSTAPEDGVSCDVASIKLLGGPDKGKTIRLDFPESTSTPKLEKGDVLVLSYTPEADPGFQYQFSDRARKPLLIWLAILFAVAVVVLGRLRGIAALAGLGATLVVLLTFVLPAIINGRSPLWVAVVGAAAISFFALYLAHGFQPMTTVALLGTLASLGLTSVLSLVFMNLARFSGFASEEAAFLSAAGGSIDLEGLMLAGVIIGALGALDDMTVTQASAVWELRAADPTLTPGSLFRAGMRIGRDHVASTVNTLFLAYAGASMPLLVLFVLSKQSLGTVANSEVVATEIVRTLVGSIGLVASVPLTTWLAARVAGEALRDAEAAPAPAE